MKILLANPRGFCAGVDRAIEIVERALDAFGAPIYVRHEVVHNRFVVQSLRDRGAVFVDELSEIPDGGTVIFSAHGVSQQVREEADQRQLSVFDATCPLVTKVHLAVARYCRAGQEVVLIGHKGHPEVEGTMGQYRCPPQQGGIYLVETPQDVDALEIHNPDKLAFVTQTTLSMHDTAKVIEALQERFPAIKGPRKDDICYATQNRQDAVTRLAAVCDLVLVVGSPNSSNSNRLKEIAEKYGRSAHLIDGPQDIQRDWLQGVERIGVTAGASAPEVLVESVIKQLKDWGAGSVEEDSGEPETVVFALPKNLLSAMANGPEPRN
jgi:4-hydroxy-3-methylbut-2-enyl diphosphate reductase